MFHIVTLNGVDSGNAVTLMCLPSFQAEVWLLGWWFCGLGRRDQSVLGFLLLRDLMSKLPGHALFFWYIGTFHSKEFRNVYCGKVKFFYKQYCFCNFATLLKHANNLLCITGPAVTETEWTVTCLCVVQFICCRLEQILCTHWAYIVLEILQQGKREEDLMDAA